MLCKDQIRKGLRAWNGAHFYQRNGMKKGQLALGTVRTPTKPHGPAVRENAEKHRTSDALRPFKELSQVHATR